MSQFVLDPFVDMPDDDDMPPLVDRPPPPLMTTMPMISYPYSFDADFPTIPYSPYSFLGPADAVPEPTPRFELISEEDTPRISATATDAATAAAVKPSHAKKRDAGHIPRPPNAFILFRSSFIKSESVPGNIEGNHSTLSKIIGAFPPLLIYFSPTSLCHRLTHRHIGIVWKTLPPAERQLWEKRAVQAQADHRARYPDWRFRPGTNVDAIAKRKTKDKNKDRPPTRRRRNPNTRDKDFVAVASAGPTDSGGNDGDSNWDGGGAVRRGGRCKGKRRGIIQERRCAQIAGLLARGVKGVELSSAVQAWDKESGVSNVTDGMFVSEQVVQGLGADTDATVDMDVASPSASHKEIRGAKNSAEVVEVVMEKGTVKMTKARSMSSAQPPRFNVPLTSMFRRASSAPLVPENGAVAQGATTIVSITSTTMSVSPVPDLYPPPLSPASSVSYGSEVSFPDSDNMSVAQPMFDFVPFSPPGSPCSSNMDNNDIGVLGSVNPNADVGTHTHTHNLGIDVALGAGQGQGPESASSLQSFFFSDYSSYSTLCDWAGGINTTGSGIIDGTHHHDHHANNAKAALPPYTCFGENGSEIENSFSFLPTTSAVMDPWNNVHDLVVARPGLDGLEDTLWPGGARVATPYA